MYGAHFIVKKLGFGATDCSLSGIISSLQNCLLKEKRQKWDGYPEVSHPKAISEWTQSFSHPYLSVIITQCLIYKKFFCNITYRDTCVLASPEIFVALEQ